MIAEGFLPNRRHHVYKRGGWCGGWEFWKHKPSDERTWIVMKQIPFSSSVQFTSCSFGEQMFLIVFWSPHRGILLVYSGRSSVRASQSDISFMTMVSWRDLFAMIEMLRLFSIVATNHMCLLTTWNMAIVAEQLNFNSIWNFREFKFNWPHVVTSCHISTAQEGLISTIFPVVFIIQFICRLTLEKDNSSIAFSGY